VESVISNLVNRYERGLLTRRDLIQGLAMLAGAGAAVTASAAAPLQDSSSAVAPLQATSIDHVSIQAKDLDQTVNFYKNVFGLPFLNEDKKTKTVRLKVGGSRIAIRNVEPYGVVDHFAFGVAHFDKASVIEKLKQQNVPPLQTSEPLLFHVLDPDGYPVQIISTDNR
jgi:glyoxalase/bleomycin resistance protein/dioxygenase superfamily protein